MVKDIKIADFNYPLPDERIPRHPLAQRDACRLLVSRADGEIEHTEFSHLAQFLPDNALLVRNNTRVINARIKFEKVTGSKIEVFLLEPIAPADYVLMFQTRSECRWNCMVGNLKRWKNGNLHKELVIDGHDVVLTAELGDPTPGNAREIRFTWDNPEVTFASIIEAAGNIPIPPYLKRDSEQTDTEDYQTVYASVKGSVAAPTAGLHFTPKVFDSLRRKGIDVESVTLHVGAGTFQPVKSDNIGEHVMHTESFAVDLNLIERLIEAKRENRPIIAVGTTSVRTLESLPYLGAALAAGQGNITVGQWWSYEAEAPFAVADTVSSLRAIRDYMLHHDLQSLPAATSIMIAPGFRWRMVDIMVTNFHQPESTLLLLVSSFLERNLQPVSNREPRWRVLYKEALEHSYRFLSYGDACLLYPLNHI